MNYRRFPSSGQGPCAPRGHRGTALDRLVANGESRAILARIAYGLENEKILRRSDLHRSLRPVREAHDRSSKDGKIIEAGLSEESECAAMGKRRRRGPLDPIGRAIRAQTIAHNERLFLGEDELRHREQRRQHNKAVRNLARYCAATQGGSYEDYLEEAERTLRDDISDDRRRTNRHDSTTERSDGESIALSLERLHAMVGGEITASGDILAPGPGHSAIDRSMSVRPSSNNADGYVVHSFSKRTSSMECKAYVNRLVEQRLRELNEEDDERIEQPSPSAAVTIPRQISKDQKIRSAKQRWNRADTFIGKSAHDYLASRALELPPALIGSVVRFEPDGRWYHDEGDRTDRNGRRYSNSEVLVLAMRDVVSDEERAVQIVRMPHLGKKPQRKFWGSAADAAIKLTPHEEIIAAGELTIGEGFETCLAAMMMGYTNVWAVCGCDNVARFPLIDGVRKLTILGEHCSANDGAREGCALRWLDDGREVMFAMPNHDKDHNDELIELMNSRRESA